MNKKSEATLLELLLKIVSNQYVYSKKIAELLEKLIDQLSKEANDETES